MIADLNAASGTHHLVLLDPSWVSDIANLATDRLDSRIEALATDGRALLVQIPAGDCEATFRVFVNDEPPEELLAAAGRTPVTEFAMRLPSETLEAAGPEDINSPISERDPGTFSIAAIEPGTFSGRAFHTVRWKERHRQQYIAARTSPLARVLQRVQNAIGFAVAILLVSHVFVVLPLLLLAFRSGAGVGMRALAALIVLDVIVWATCDWLNKASKEHSILSQVSDLHYAFERQYPDVVVVLQSLPSGGSPPSRSPAVLVVR